ncbi:MAG: NfeD family protein [Bryobacteraceae bacterium]
MDGVVHPITVEILKHALEQARREKSEFILVRLNTPGGLLEATREAIEALAASPAPVVTYVTPTGGRAASAGFFLLQAGDIAAMSPGTNTGAASPILLGQQMDPVLRRKAENDAAAMLRALVDRRGRNSALAEKTVFEAKAFTEKEALDQKLIEIIARDETDLLAQIHGREAVRLDGSRRKISTTGVRVVTYEKSLRERVLTSISDPNVAFVLLILGALGIYVEFSSPGLILPGVAGAILGLLGLSALAVLPINWLGAALLILALSLFVLEAKFASHGILGAGGAVSMVLGAMLLVEGPPEVRIHWSTAVAVALPFTAITMFLLSLVLRARAAKVTTGLEGMMGELGEARTALRPAGKVFVHGEYWDAESSTPVETGDRVRVTGVEGLKLKVEPAGGRQGDSDV